MSLSLPTLLVSTGFCFGVGSAATAVGPGREDFLFSSFSLLGGGPLVLVDDIPLGELCVYGRFQGAMGGLCPPILLFLVQQHL